MLVSSHHAGDRWSTADAQWAQLIGFIRVQSWRTLPIEYFLVMQVLATFLSLIEIYGNGRGQDAWRDFYSGHLCSSVPLLGSHLKSLCCLLLPAIQLVAGISHASWVSLPFFICSSAGLVDWSWTSNYLGIFRWWRYLLYHAGFNIILLYIYQLPIEFPESVRSIFYHFGLFKLSTKSEWSEVCSVLSLLLFYIMLSWIRNELAEMEIITSRESDLTEELLPKRRSLFVHEFKCGVRHTSFILQGAISQTFSINFLTYGFPISLLVLSFWSFHFASLCSFGLLAYVGYILYAFPSMFRLQQLNGMLLVFILLWAASTYIFNVALTVSNNKSLKDMKIWETIGLWHYPIPAYYLLAQFGLGFLVAMCNLVNNSVLSRITDQGQLTAYESIVEVIFFLIYLLSNAINGKLRQAIILLCEAQFALQFILRLDLISKTLDQKGSFAFQILSQLGLLNDIHSVDFFKILILACFCAIHNHGLQTLLIFSAIVRHTSCPPVGFSILRAGLIKPVCLSGYSPRSSVSHETHEEDNVIFEGYKTEVPFCLSVMCIGVFSSSMTSFPGIIGLQTAFGYNPEASMLQNIWQSLAVLVVMQLYSYERRQSKSSRLPKSSQIPAKVFLVYSGLLIMVEYLFQMWGDRAKMFPGQDHFQLSLLMGLQLYKPGFKGLESGLRGKVVVIVACILQYNVFRWLEKMQHVNGNGGRWNEPCPLFSPVEDSNETTACTLLSKQVESPASPTIKRTTRSYSCPTINSGLPQGPDSAQRDSVKNLRVFHFWENSKDSLKWNRKRLLFLRKERLEMQKTVLRVSLKFWIENMFNLFGLEINMIALLLASFAVLNAISLLYIASLAACVLLHRLLIKKLWPVFVFVFASIITIEYLAIWMHLAFVHQQIGEQVPCHDCWRVSDIYFNYCKRCWLGIIVDDRRMLISYYGVFMFSCFKFRADQSSILTGLEMYQNILSQWKSASVLRTLEYDMLHFGYLGFALVFFRLRLKILKQGNKIFRFLRMYNFVVIVLSLAYQSPFVGDFREIKSGSIEHINELVGFHKYDYGFRITSRSSFVEIIIFMLVSLQSYMFSFPEFVYVSKYLEKEQIGAILRQQEKKADWKTAQLHHTRKAEELKHLRSLQVEKIKSEMLNLQDQLHNMSTDANCSNPSLDIDGLRERGNSKLDFLRENEFRKQDIDINTESVGPFDVNQSLLSEKSASPLVPEYWKHPMDTPRGILSVKERTKSSDFLDLEIRNRYKLRVRRNALVSAVHFIGNGVSQVQSLGNMAVNNLMNYLKIEREELEPTEDSSDDEEYYEIENQNMGAEPLEPTFSTHSVHEHIVPDTDSSFCKRKHQSFVEDVKCSTFQDRLQRLFLPLKNLLKRLVRRLCRYWKSLTWGAETPPYFVQLSMEVNSWPEDGIQPKRIESRINKSLKILHNMRCKEDNRFNMHSASRVRVQSIEKSEENENLCLVVFEVLYASPSIELTAEEWYSSLTPAEDVSNEIRKAQQIGIIKEIGFPYRIISVIGGGKREIDLYAYIFGADLAVFFLIAIFYESVMKANSEFLEVYQLEDQFPEDFVLVLMILHVLYRVSLG
ncbi:hypothetical protein TSUD_345470 [Trifolium subterraneum]|nr:hypothetical protein TSUD_345470 [Trifolium subterraneum]